MDLLDLELQDHLLDLVDLEHLLDLVDQFHLEHLLDLVDQSGQLHLHHPVGQYLPELQLHLLHLWTLQGQYHHLRQNHLQDL